MPARRRLAALLCALVTVTGITPAAAAGPPGQAPEHVVLVGVPGLRWSDLSPAATPALWRLAGTGADGALSVRTVKTTACPADGWLTVSAGRRAQDAAAAEPGEPCGEILPPLGGPDAPKEVPGWGRIRGHNDRLSYDAVPGVLGDALAGGGRCAVAVGPGAALALADGAGRVTNYVGGVDLVDGETLARCPIGVVDAGAVLDEPRRPPRAEQVRAADAAVARVVAALPPGATLLVAGLADGSRSQAHLGVALATGPGGPGRPAYDGTWLATASTRRQALVQLTDVTPTLVELAGLPRIPSAVGSPWRGGDGRPGAAAAAQARLADLDDAARIVNGVVPWFFTLLIALQLLMYAGAAVALRRSWGGAAVRRRVLDVTARSALAFAGVPVATFLANLLPWWRAPLPLLPLVGVVAGWTALVAAAALLGPWRRSFLGPLAVVAGATAGVLGVDVVTGSRLQLSSLMGYSPLVAGRFYGFGNVAFALFATGALLAVAAAVDRLVGTGRRAAALAAVAAVGVVTVAVDGSPAWGADFGGVVSLVPGFAVLALLVAGLRVSVVRFLLVCGAGVVVVAAMAVLDWLRPAAERTHLGRFVQQVLDGELGTVVGRKLAANIGLLTSSLAVLVPFALVFVVLVLMRPVSWHAAALDLAYRRSHTLRAGLVATLVAMLVGFAVNDSGIAIPAVSLTVAVPLALAASAWALLLEEAPAATVTPSGAPPRETAR